MSEQIVIGLFTLVGILAGGFLGGFFSVRAAKIGYNKVQMEKEIKFLANQVKSYWLLEKEYLSQLEKHTGLPAKTLMEKTRKIVKNNGNEYPYMTAYDADSILRNYK